MSRTWVTVCCIVALGAAWLLQFFADRSADGRKRERITAITFSELGDRLFVATSSGSVYGLRSDGTQVSVIHSKGCEWINAVASSSCGKYVLAGERDGVVRRMLIESGECVDQWDAGSVDLGELRTCRGSGEDYVLSTHIGRSMRVWDAVESRVVRQLSTPWDTILAGAADEQCTVIAAVTGNGYVWVWQGESWESVQRVKVSQSPLNSVSVGPSGRKLAVGGQEGVVSVWLLRDDLYSFGEVRMHDWVQAVMFSGSEELIVAITADGSIAVVDVPSCKVIRYVQSGLNGSAVVAALDRRTNMLAVAGPREICVWRLDGDELQFVMKRAIVN